MEEELSETKTERGLMGRVMDSGLRREGRGVAPLSTTVFRVSSREAQSNESSLTMVTAPPMVRQMSATRSIKFLGRSS
jgi:hypothetical protein